MPTTQLHEATMSVDTVAARTDSAGGAVTPDWRAEERRMGYALFTEGVLPVPVNAFQTVEGAGGTMNIVVGSDAAEVDQALVAGQIAGQGKYMLRLDEATKTISLDAAGASDRTDELYLTMYDNSYDSQSRALPRFAIRKGDAGGAAPGPDANWEAYLLLASVFIPASAPNIAACTITDGRVFTGLNVGARGAPGVIEMFGGTNAPAGALLCNGQAVSRTTYKRLFAEIGTTWGVGDGSTTFNVPDMRGRYPRGVAASGTGDALGEEFGSDLLVDHTHPVDPPSTGTSGTIGTTQAVQSGSGTNVPSLSATHNVDISSFASGTVTGTNPEQLPASLALNYIIWT